MSITAARNRLVGVRKELREMGLIISDIEQGSGLRRKFDPDNDHPSDNKSGYVCSVIKMPSFIAHNPETYQEFKITLDEYLPEIATVSDTDGFEKENVHALMVADYLKRKADAEQDG